MLTKDNKNRFLQYRSRVTKAHTVPVLLHGIRKLWKQVSLTKIMYWLEENDKYFSLIFAYVVAVASGCTCIMHSFIGTVATCRSSSRDHAKARKFTHTGFPNHMGNTEYGWKSVLFVLLVSLYGLKWPTWGIIKSCSPTYLASSNLRVSLIT